MYKDPGSVSRRWSTRAGSGMRPTRRPRRPRATAIFRAVFTVPAGRKVKRAACDRRRGHTLRRLLQRREDRGIDSNAAMPQDQRRHRAGAAGRERDRGRRPRTSARTRPAGLIGAVQDRVRSRRAAGDSRRATSGAPPPRWRTGGRSRAIWIPPGRPPKSSAHTAWRRGGSRVQRRAPPAGAHAAQGIRGGEEGPARQRVFLRPGLSANCI